MKIARTSNALGHFEPSLTYQFMKGCACGSPHPIALKSPNPAICPGCGAPAAPPGNPRTVRATLTGRSLAIIIGRFFLAMGEALAKLARKD